MAAKEADARTALKALFASGKPAKPKAAPGAPAEQVEGSHDPWSTVKAGMALRHLFRAEIHKALHPPKAANRMEEMQGQISRLLDQVAPEKADSMDKVETNNSGPSMGFHPPERKRGSSKKVDIAAQTDPLLSAMRFVEPPPEEVPPPVELPPEEKPSRLKLIFQENHREADNLRNDVKESRCKLQVLDAETTRLTRELKKCRKALWEQQREQSSTDSKISSIITQHATDLDEAQGKELVRLESEERQLAQELSEARQVAGKWSNIARRQDEMLKQEREQAKEDDVHKILLKHPAGEVFLPPMLPNDGSDDMSDDEYYREGPRHQFNRRRDEEEPTLASDSEDEYDRARAQPDRTPPPPPSQQWRPTAREADNDSEGGSSVTSPSGSESLRGTPKEGDAGRGRMLGSGPSASSSAHRNTRADSDYSSDDEVVKKPASAPSSAAESKPPAETEKASAVGPAWTRGEMEKPAGTKDMGSWTKSVYTPEQQERLKVDEEGKACEAMKTTPPLPELKGGTGSITQVSALDMDSAEEVSSEEGLDTSRSV